MSSPDALDPKTAGPTGSATDELLRRLAGSPSRSRYEVRGELARGGMGAILKIWDKDLRRDLAMKVVLERGEALDGRHERTSDRRALTRFLEEAQVTGQLDHPGIVPVHELGLDSRGSPYFTMKLVQGRNLQAIFDLVFRGEEGWNETRALGLILRVCEAMDYAHQKGVIHRDLKPANVMVGDFGEVFVMDWGLARVLGQADPNDARVRARSGVDRVAVRTERSDDREDIPDSPLLTRAGDVMGTPAYMPPEQARGEIESLTARSDVYSVGAMLYHLLARRMPYVPPHGGWSPLLILERVRQGPPLGLSECGRDVPAEIAAICEKAMARDPGDRYPDMRALAGDLRAYLEHRVVSAYETGAWAEARKWVRRNRGLATASAAALVLAMGGLALNSYNQTRAAGKIAEKEQLATAKANDVLSLSAIQDLKDLERRADALWPARADMLASYDAWLDDARALLDGRPEDASKLQKRRPSLADHKAKLSEIEARAESVTEQGEFVFPDSEDRWWHSQLAQLVHDLEAFTDARTGLDSDGVSSAHGWGIRRRRRVAAEIDERTVSGAEARSRWEAAILGVSSNPRYAGLRLAPQVGLVPVGEDPHSRLWEFACPETGEPPERDADGRLVVTPESSLVLVLLPGGTFSMGSQSIDPNAAGFEANPGKLESPVTSVRIGPFFLSKFEMTQGQWMHLYGRNPSAYPAGKRQAKEEPRMDLRQPVESLSWIVASTCMSRLGLELPTEAQWEYATRAGTTSPWFTGDDAQTLRGFANLADDHLKRIAFDPTICEYAGWDDGWAIHAPVGSLMPNAFGLHDTAGNVMEWCRDVYCVYGTSPRENDGLRECGEGARIIRGGAWDGMAAYLRSANRVGNSPEFASHNLGLRPARRLAD